MNLPAEPLEVIDVSDADPTVLLTPAAAVPLPLSAEVKAFIPRLVAKFTALNAAGLAAPQVGAGIQMLVYHAPESVRGFRPDLGEPVPVTVLINPHFEPLTDEQRLDWEGCFSVRQLLGKVWRFTKVRVTAIDQDGAPWQKEVSGFEARVLQHEIDHLRGITVRDTYDQECVGPANDMGQVRRAELIEQAKALVSAMEQAKAREAEPESSREL